MPTDEEIKSTKQAYANEYVLTTTRKKCVIAALEAAEKVRADKVLIWSVQHKAYWRSNSQGYTANIAAAGIYERIKAIEIRKGADCQLIIELDEAFASLQLQAKWADLKLLKTKRALEGITSDICTDEFLARN